MASPEKPDVLPERPMAAQKAPEVVPQGTAKTIKNVFNHLVLPPQLPRKRDSNLDSIGNDIADRIRRACTTLKATTGDEMQHTWAAIDNTIWISANINGRHCTAHSILGAFKNLKNEKAVLAFYIEEQNAALLMYMQIDLNGSRYIVFEAFEAAPLSEDVLAIPDALLWSFPSRAVRIPEAEFLEADFQSTLATFLIKANDDYISHLAAKARKAGVEISETRNAASPALITHMLLSLLEAIGGAATVSKIHKRVRDDVNFGDRELPWRRLPLWLVFRVTIQRQLGLIHGKAVAYTCYKILSCMILSELIEDCVQCRMTPALLSLLQKKLARKLAKLEQHHLVQDASDQDSIHIHAVIKACASTFKASLTMANRCIEGALSKFKTDSMRRIPKLPLQAPASDLYLSLPASKRFLDRISQPFDAKTGWNTYGAQTTKVRSWGNDPSKNPAIGCTQSFYKKVLAIHYIISDARAFSTKAWSQLGEQTTNLNALKKCDRIAKTVTRLIKSINHSDAAWQELNSLLLLEIFDQWAILDAICVQGDPSLGEYRPVFWSSLLDVLHLPDLDSMRRLRQIQKYISHRNQKSVFPQTSIFEKGGIQFAAQYASKSPKHVSLHAKVMSDQDKRKTIKEKDWEASCRRYDELSRDIYSSTCTCVSAALKSGVKECNACSLKTTRDAMRIKIFEDLLPDNRTEAMAIVFELDVPKFVAVYRDVTWDIKTSVTLPQLPDKITEVKKLNKTQLKAHYKAPLYNSITLASYTKAFQQTHYKRARMKCELSKVLLPFGAPLRPFHNSLNMWISDLSDKMTLAHLSPIRLPTSLRAPDLLPVDVFPSNPRGPSSYEIVASRRECPADSSVHEFEAFQRLLSGTSRRWLTMVVEMGCTNINFSKEDAVVMFSHLAQEVGPLSKKSKGGVAPFTVSHEEALGDIHQVLLEDAILDRFLKEIEKRIQSIENNWREVVLMELAITLLLRVKSLLPDNCPNEHLDSLLHLARQTTLAWTEGLRDDIANASDEDASGRASMYAFKAALLCRHTFTPLAAGHKGEMTGSDLEIFLRASFSMQQNLIVSISALSHTDRGYVVRDTAMVFRLAKKIRDAANLYPEKINEAVLHALGMLSVQSDISESNMPVFGKWSRQQDGSSSEWYSSTLQYSGTVSQDTATTQHISIDLIHGHLLVDGETIGKLPDNIRNSGDVEEVLGNKYLLSFPSAILGMSHCLATTINNHSIHFGTCVGGVTILSIGPSGHIYQYIPRRMFVNASNNAYDLPRGLVDDCYHWVNKSSGLLEIRRSLTRWQLQPNDWILDIRRRQASRPGDVLVDPLSNTAELMSEIFVGFEDVQRLTIFQPVESHGQLSMELRHLELSFFVNQQGNLECRELGAEVDADQDAGTLYGYRSMIVLRDTSDQSRRSIIAPLGNLEWRRFGVHISVKTVIHSGALIATTEKAYARFDIDTVLGRLTCPPEPRLLYTKAQLHAFTSTCLPDPLTGRTGEEEAMHTLLSGRLQPWVPLPPGCLHILQQISMLVPKREYYPPDKRVLQTVKWAKHLPVGMQNDRYGRVVRGIVRKALHLRLFDETTTVENKELDGMYETLLEQHSSNLTTRGEVQRMRYECPRQDTEPSCRIHSMDGKYLSLGYVDTLGGKTPGGLDYGSSSVFQVVKMLLEKPTKIPLSRKAWATFNAWGGFGGYVDAWKPCLVSMSTLMDRSTLIEQWGSLVQMCRQSSSATEPGVIFTLACLAFAPDIDIDSVRLLAAYTYLPDLQSIKPPAHPAYTGFVHKQYMTGNMLIGVIESELVAFTPKANTTRSERAAARAATPDVKQRAEYEQGCHDDCIRLSKKIASKWPHTLPRDMADFQSPYINVNKALCKIRKLWDNMLRNRELSAYLEEVEAVMAPKRAYALPPSASSANQAMRPFPTLISHPAKTTSLAHNLVKRRFSGYIPRPLQLSPCWEPATSSGGPTKGHTNEHDELRRIIRPFTQSTEPMRRDYGRDLDASLNALESAARMSLDVVPKSQANLQQMETVVSGAKEKIRIALDEVRICFSEVFGSPHHSFANNWLEMAGLWPRVTPVSVLELLRSTSNTEYGDGVKEALVRYGELLCAAQRFSRIYRALSKGDERRVQEELANEGHTNWSTRDNPDWLLLEVDSNVLIREEQVTVARAMIAPESGANAVFQLNMGKGKTSIILPMVLSVLADQQQLARLIAPKALLLPTAQILQSRLGGLIGREVRHVPFSRRLVSLPCLKDTIHMFQKHHTDLASAGGILITVPEHVLAFTLSGQQCYIDGQLEIARVMMDFDNTMRGGFCRDVLDESDFTLAVRTQLVYPSGKLTAIDGAPFRWELVQSLLSLLEEHAVDLAAKNPHKINVVKRPNGGFPTIYILHASVDDELRRRLTLDIVNGRVPFFRHMPKVHGSSADKSTVPSLAKMKQLLQQALESNSSGSAIDDAAKLWSDTNAITSGLLLVRGLLKHDIITTCLKRRWNVQYGLHPRRWPIAVPFEARGVPSERSEFGHPDVAITFTCLAFYYAGISLQQFREGLSHILHHVNDPSVEYEKWSSGDGNVVVPEDLQHWNSINMDDGGQMERLWKCLRFTRPVINHYLNTFVFPVHSRQFSIKLQASAWDLPLFTVASGSDKPSMGARTTGFSGTNDNKAMLPLSIAQQDLPGLQQTNAEVLSYLLQLRNRSYIRTGAQHQRWSEQDLVVSLSKYRIQVFIDAGAYILESTNEDLARSWLSIAEASVKAAVYFDEKDNRAWVVFRDATAARAPLVSTPFAERLDECIVYFDEAHTRGVDLLLPPNARGALTLALGQTKDHTVQAAMRLRQLGSTQSVVFYAPPEVDQSIRDTFCLGNLSKKALLDSSHVVAWLLEQTCQANEQLGPLYASHGLDFCRRAEALSTHQTKLLYQKSRKVLLKVLQQPERQTLKTMYGNATEQDAPDKKSSGFSFPVLQQFAKQLNAYHLGGAKASAASKGAFEEVEQEREVEVQVEQQRSVERKTKYTALKFPGHVSPSIREFVKTGTLARSSESYESVFDFVSHTDIGHRHDVCHVDTALFVSKEFRRTIDTTKLTKHRYDDFLRPVEWLLWSPSTKTGLVVIPEEMELLLQDIRASKRTQLMAYAAPVTRSMLDFSSLRYLTFPSVPGDDKIPEWLPIELGILAGRLYMTYDEAMDMAEYLGQPIHGDGDPEPGKARQFCRNPASFLLEWLPLRRAAQDVLHTPAAEEDEELEDEGGVKLQDEPQPEPEPEPEPGPEPESEDLMVFDEEDEENDVQGGKCGVVLEAGPYVEPEPRVAPRVQPLATGYEMEISDKMAALSLLQMSIPML